MLRHLVFAHSSNNTCVTTTIAQLRPFISGADDIIHHPNSVIVFGHATGTTLWSCPNLDLFPERILITLLLWSSNKNTNDTYMSALTIRTRFFFIFSRDEFFHIDELKRAGDLNSKIRTCANKSVKMWVHVYTRMRAEQCVYVGPF